MSGRARMIVNNPRRPGEPSYFNCHTGDVRYTMIFAPTMAGKCVDYSALLLTEAEAAKIRGDGH